MYIAFVALLLIDYAPNVRMYNRVHILFCSLPIFHSMGKLCTSPTMDFRPHEALFFGDNFFKLVTIGFKFSHHPFQPKRRYPSIWSLNKILKFGVPVIDP